MPISSIELPEQLGGKIKVLYETEDQRKKLRKFMKMIPSHVVMDGEVLT